MASLASKRKRAIEAMIEYALLFAGKWYKWGGDDPSGFDCSGLIVEVLKSVGIMDRGDDKTAQGIADMLTSCIVHTPYRGCLVFYWSKDGSRVVHVELCLDDYRTIGASGGYSKTTSVELAIKHNAFIKIRPINDRRGGVTFADPSLMIK